MYLKEDERITLQQMIAREGLETVAKNSWVSTTALSKAAAGVFVSRVAVELIQAGMFRFASKQEFAKAAVSRRSQVRPPRGCDWRVVPCGAPEWVGWTEALETFVDRPRSWDALIAWFNKTWPKTTPEFLQHQLAYLSLRGKIAFTDGCWHPQRNVDVIEASLNAQATKTFASTGVCNPEKLHGFSR